MDDIRGFLSGIENLQFVEGAFLFCFDRPLKADRTCWKGTMKTRGVEKDIVGKFLPAGDREIQRTLELASLPHLVNALPLQIQLDPCYWPTEKPHILLITHYVPGDHLFTDVITSTPPHQNTDPNLFYGDVCSVTQSSSFYATRLDPAILTTREAKIEFLAQLVQALERIHENQSRLHPKEPPANHAHLDLHPGNIKVDKWGHEDQGRLYITIIDLGIRLGHANVSWAAPEHFQLDPSLLSPKTDVYTFGLYIVRLFKDLHNEPILKLIAQDCLAKEPNDRPSTSLLRKRVHALRSKQRVRPLLFPLLITGIVAFFFGLWILAPGKGSTSNRDLFPDDGASYAENALRTISNDPSSFQPYWNEIQSYLNDPLTRAQTRSNLTDARVNILTTYLEYQNKESSKNPALIAAFNDVTRALLRETIDEDLQTLLVRHRYELYSLQGSIASPDFFDDFDFILMDKVPAISNHGRIVSRGYPFSLIAGSSRADFYFDTLWYDIKQDRLLFRLVNFKTKNAHIVTSQFDLFRFGPLRPTDHFLLAIHRTPMSTVLDYLAIQNGARYTAQHPLDTSIPPSTFQGIISFFDMHDLKETLMLKLPVFCDTQKWTFDDTEPQHYLFFYYPNIDYHQYPIARIFDHESHEFGATLVAPPEYKTATSSYTNTFYRNHFFWDDDLREIASAAGFSFHRTHPTDGELIWSLQLLDN